MQPLNHHPTAYDNLSQSIVRQQNSGENMALSKLVDFAFFDSNQDPNSYFSNEGGHVICLENGKVFDHSVSDVQSTFRNPHIRACLNGSQLFRVGATCMLEAHCSGETFLFNIHQQEPTRLSNDIDEQIFICPDMQFVKRNKMSLHTENGNQTGMVVTFPHETILQGHCLIVNNQNTVFFATLADGIANIAYQLH